ncbi:MAG: hemerythrin domain-containing protein [Chloroflexi bacterium]|nr:hemerythrin domain-containing protein [Chloroflexota bacterium]
MTFDKSCPGSRVIREPRPELYNCPGCGREVEIWTDELKATCRNCGNKVFREQQVSCIDWCPHAKECVGPEVYARLKPGAQDDLSGTPLDVLKREHDRALENIGLLRGASLCLKLGSLKADSPVRDRGLGHLDKVLEFFDKDIRLHFRREEEVLFPYLDRHIGGEKSPTKLLLQDHGEVWQHYDRLKEKLAELQKNGNGQDETLSAIIQKEGGVIESLLREHIKKENESLLPIAKSLLTAEELEEMSQKWRKVGN